MAPKKKKSKSLAEKRKAAIAKVVNYFDTEYGREDDKLATWQALCRAVDVPEGQSIVQCRKHLEKVYVNIFDFVKAMEEDKSVHKFPSLEDLRSYSKKSCKLFPLEEAKENLMLRGLLVCMSGRTRWG